MGAKAIWGLAVLLWLSGSNPVWAQQTVLEVIPLKYRQAEEMIPVLRPLLPPQGSVSGLNNRLIVRTTPENLAEIRQILAAIDVAARRLVVLVRQEAEAERDRRGAQVSGRVEIGDKVTVTQPGRPTPPGATARVDDVRAKVYSSSDQSNESVSQRVQVLEGGRAFIRLAQSTPVRTRQTVNTPSGRRVIESTELHEADTGFYVVPHLSGDRVTLEILTAASSLQADGAAGVQGVQTTVSGRLGEWIEVGGIGQQSNLRESEILARGSEARRDARRVLLKVEEVQ